MRVHSVSATLSRQEARDSRWDVVIVGAGLAGSVAAIGLAKRGLRVLLVDQKSFPRPKVCGACLNADAVAGIDHLGLGKKLKRLEGIPLDRYHLASGGQSFEMDLPPGLAVSRTSLDAMLIEAAIDAGCDFLPDSRARLIEQEASDSEFRRLELSPVRREESNDPVFGRLVIMASGLGSDSAGDIPEVQVRESPDSRIGVGATATDFPDFYREGCIFMAVADAGYVGLTRVEGGGLNLAAALDRQTVRGSSPAEVCRRILESAGFPTSEGMLAGRFSGTPTLTRSRPSAGMHRVLFVGDAIGYVEPFTGEGMAWAIRGGRAIVPLAAEAAHAWDDSVIRRWDQVTTDLVRSQQGICKTLSRLLRHRRLVHAVLFTTKKIPLIGRFLAHSINKERKHDVFHSRDRHRSAA